MTAKPAGVRLETNAPTTRPKISMRDADIVHIPTVVHNVVYPQSIDQKNLSSPARTYR